MGRSDPDAKFRELEQQVIDLKEERDGFASEMLGMEQEVVEAQNARIALKQAEDQVQRLTATLNSKESMLQAATSQCQDLLQQLREVAQQWSWEQHKLEAGAPSTHLQEGTRQLQSPGAHTETKTVVLAGAAPGGRTDPGKSSQEQENRSAQRADVALGSLVQKQPSVNYSETPDGDNKENGFTTPTKEVLESNLKWQELKNIKTGDTKWFKVPDSLALSQAARHAQQALAMAEEQYLASAEKPRSAKYREPWAPPAVGSLKFNQFSSSLSLVQDRNSEHSNTSDPSEA